MEELDDDSDISSEMVSSSSNDYPQAYGSSSTLVRSDDSTSLSMVLASRLPHPSPGPARATTPTVELPWVPCTMVNVAVKPDVQSWGGRKGFITEIMGTHGYKVGLHACLLMVLIANLSGPSLSAFAIQVDIAGETRSLTPGASTVFPPVTVVLTLDQIEATRPVSGDQVVIISVRIALEMSANLPPAVRAVAELMTTRQPDITSSRSEGQRTVGLQGRSHRNRLWGRDRAHRCRRGRCGGLVTIKGRRHTSPPSRFARQERPVLHQLSMQRSDLLVAQHVLRAPVSHLQPIPSQQPVLRVPPLLRACVCVCQTIVTTGRG